MGHDHHAVDVAEHEIAGVNHRVPNLDGHLILLDVPPPDGTGGRLEARKYRIFHTIDEVQIAHAAVDDRPGATPLARRRRHDLAPVRASHAAAAGPYRDRAARDAVQHGEARLRIVVPRA